MNLRVSLVVLCFAAAVSHGATQIEAALQQGNALLGQGRYEEARRELERVTREHPQSAEAFVLLGVTDMQLHDATAAEAALKRALQLKPQSVDALYNLGVVMLEGNRPKQAIGNFEKASRLGLHSPELAVNRVRAYLDAGDRQNGLRVATDARKSYSSLPAFQLALGTVFLRHGMPAEARSSLQEADRLARSQAEILMPLADACLELSDLECAAGALAQSRASAGDTAQYHFLQGRASFLGGREDEGFREIGMAVAHEPGNLTYLLAIGRYFQKYGRQQQAMAAFENAARLEPDLPEATYGLAVSYFIQNDFSRAIELSSHAVELDPAFDRAVFLLGISRFAKNQFAEAEKLLARAIQLQPRNAFYTCFQGMILLSTERLPEAVGSLQESIRLNPSYALAHYQLGRALVRMGRHAEAKEPLQRAVALQPDLGEAYYQLGTVYRRLGENEKAAEALAIFKRYRTDQPSERSEVLKRVQESFQDSRK